MEISRRANFVDLCHVVQLLNSKVSFCMWIEELVGMGILPGHVGNALDAINDEDVRDHAISTCWAGGFPTWLGKNARWMQS